MMMWRIAQASVLLGSGGARPACETRQLAAPPRNHPAWANRSDRPVPAGRGDSGVIAARDDGGARALTASASEVLFRRATTLYEIKMLGYSFQACHGLAHQANPPVRMTTMAPRAAAGRTFGPERRISKISLEAANASQRPRVADGTDREPMSPSQDR